MSWGHSLAKPKGGVKRNAVTILYANRMSGTQRMAIANCHPRAYRSLQHQQGQGGISILSAVRHAVLPTNMCLEHLPFMGNVFELLPIHLSPHSPSGFSELALKPNS